MLLDQPHWHCVLVGQELEVVFVRLTRVEPCSHRGNRQEKLGGEGALHLLPSGSRARNRQKGVVSRARPDVISDDPSELEASLQFVSASQQDRNLVAAPPDPPTDHGRSARSTERDFTYAKKFAEFHR